MLVEINLLPRKEYKNRAIFLIVVLILFVGVGGATAVYSIYKNTVETEEQLNSQITSLQEQRAAVEMKFSTDQESTNILKLEKTVNWANEYFVETVPLLNHLSSLLPERGFIQAFSYVEDGIVSLVVQFDTNPEIAHYLAALNESEYIVETKLHSVTTAPTMEEGITETAIATVGQNEQQDADASEEESSEITSRETVISESRKKETEVTIPRYLAQFELKVNKDALKKLQKEGK
ncbi:PilN domain-containing protein [Fredinandcohnia onubensis]|uniref:PilN domain-containing protein n=1 Tax=Fredinandcohnia onubensis TaxID=1571209 RepID=UPI000C0BD4BF|nr:PilN domain-containing protein [Fredinandcohnia onubensis]